MLHDVCYPKNINSYIVYFSHTNVSDFSENTENHYFISFLHNPIFLLHNGLEIIFLIITHQELTAIQLLNRF